MRAAHLLLPSLLAFAGLVSSQDAAENAAPKSPAPEGQQQPDGVAELIQAVRRAHRPGQEGETEQPIDQFRATLRVTSVRADDDNIEVDLDASFLLPRYLRYRVQDPSAVLERGWDQEGGWARTDDRVLPLEGKDFASERDEVQRHIRLARQLLSFLDPGTVFARMTVPESPRDTELDLGRMGKLPTHVLEGTVASFPLFAPPADGDPNPPAKLTIWVDSATDRLAAVLVQPLDARGRASTSGEFFLLQDYPDTPRQGVCLPLRLVIYRSVRDRKQPEATVDVRAIDFTPGLTVEKMQRPAD